jgi:hypothetical protein
MKEKAVLEGRGLNPINFGQLLLLGWRSRSW